jgi:hypothetical protein
VKVVIDENLPLTLAQALNALASNDGHTVKHSTEIAERGAKDVDLFKVLSDEKYEIHITQDHHQRKQIERKAIADAGLIVFVLAKSWSTQPFWIKSAQLVRWWPLVIDHASRMKPPACFRVPWKIQGQGKFEQLKL